MENQIEDLQRTIKESEKNAKHWAAKLAELREKVTRAAEEAKAEAEELAIAAAEDGVAMDTESTDPAAAGSSSG